MTLAELIAQRINMQFGYKSTHLLKAIQEEIDDFKTAEPLESDTLKRLRRAVKNALSFADCRCFNGVTGGREFIYRQCPSCLAKQDVEEAFALLDSKSEAIEPHPRPADNLVPYLLQRLELERGLYRAVTEFGGTVESFKYVGEDKFEAQVRMPKILTHVEVNLKVGEEDSK